MQQPSLVFFVVAGDPTNFQWVRYTYTTALMSDGFYEFAPDGDYGFGTVEWYDEFDLAGTDTTSWMGRATTAPPTQPWKSGVYRRDFENAVALVNPRGNGLVTVTVESGLHRIAGKQDPGVNNGMPASEITLGDGDGIVLVRDAYLNSSARPRPPEVIVD